ncbi:MAG TPA: hypothetical protein VHX49_16395 [Candidatus Acidoferrales bacterium]|jgi:hypothetical protein|nr:hypothetical protein [Candidatus Acidoferrales bacterium]
MSVKSSLILAIALICALPLSANDKKKDVKRGMLEKMEAVPCGARERGLSGLGTLWASAGITHVNSDEKLCPQYLLRTDQMDYEIRPMDLKHASILPVGQEAQFKMKNKDMILDVPEAGLHKMRAYEVVGMNPNNTDSDDQKSSSLDPDDDR